MVLSGSIDIENGGGSDGRASSICERECILLSQHSHHHTQHADKTKEWVQKFPIGLGLCPWAGKSHNKGLLRTVTCQCDVLADATERIEREIELLTCEGTPPLSTTLMVCPHVRTWKDFQSFDEFVRTGIKQQLKNVTILENVILVAFHPDFLRWHGLPAGIGVGSVIHSHWGMIGRKSVHTAPATIIETTNRAFGLRKIKIRFHDILEGLSRQ